VRELSALRQGSELIEPEETRLLRGLSLQDGVRQWLALQRTFEFQLLQTQDLFGPERWAALGELQARLRRLSG